MKRGLVALFALVCGFAASSANAAEQWVYAEWYPFIYCPAADNWIYEPSTPPLVWDYGAGDWVPNPLGTRSFDIRETFDKSPLQLDLAIDGAVEFSMRVQFNFSGVDTSIVSSTYDGTSDTETVYTRHCVDACAGTALMLGAFPDGDNFALELTFETATSGTFRMIGIHPYGNFTMELHNCLGIFTGTFTLDQMQEE